jgi:phosphoglycerol transferase
MGGYDPLRGYLHDNRLRWSFGAMRGRAADWAAQLATQPTNVRLPAIAAAGFDGLWLDTSGFPGPASAVISTYSRALGTEPITAANGTLAFFDLRPYAARLQAAVGAPVLTRARRAVLYPLTVGDPSAGPPPPLQLTSAPQKLTLINPGSAAAAAELTIYATGAAPGTLTLRGSGFVSSAPLRPATAGVETARLAIRLAPGTTRLQISSTTGARAAVAVITDRALLEL